ncbi:hypothetical protein Bhyg_06303 [Pseudolycoriella hygida]|uniref:Uncharacterized protein n=1 Tax=Pseudolycoriella hygida TaxID=35572 RepID=A0A9Q0N2C9_9DIPT|nr:hypothetical protein Bhyg_06303 [Pseudolycoriella hygida]
MDKFVRQWRIAENKSTEVTTDSTMKLSESSSDEPSSDGHRISISHIVTTASQVVDVSSSTNNIESLRSPFVDGDLIPIRTRDQQQAS